MPHTSHKSTSGLKQSNKRHKRAGGSSSKRAISRGQGAGKIESHGSGSGSSRTPASSHAPSLSDARHNKVNKAKQMKQNKRQQLVEGRRVGTRKGPPKIVGFVHISEGLHGALTPATTEEDLKAHVLKSADLVLDNTGKFEQMKTRLTILTPSDFGSARGSEAAFDRVQSALYVARSCDVLCVVIDGSVEEEEDCVSFVGEQVLTALKNQGLPNTMAIVTGLGDKHIKKNKKKKQEGDMRRYCQRLAAAEFGTETKVIELDLKMSEGGVGGVKEEDSDDDDMGMGMGIATATATATATTTKTASQQNSSLIRALCSAVATPIQFVNARPFLLTDSSKSYAYDASTKELHLTGYVRSHAPFDVNSLVHVPGMGTFQQSRILAAGEPVVFGKGNNNNSSSSNSSSSSSSSSNSKPTTLAVPNPSLQEQLNMFATANSLDGEQNLIGFDAGDENAMAEFDDDNDDNNNDAAEDEKKVARPAGWSDYQAAWLEDADKGEFAGSDDEDDGEYADMFNQKGSKSNSDGDNSNMDDNEEEDGKISEAERLALAKRRKEHDEELEFPDEVEIHEGDSAKDRFARYRSMQSFKTSVWDPKENLPDDYATLYHFGSFKATRAAVLADQRDVVNAQRLNNEGGGAEKNKKNKEEEVVGEMVEEEEEEDLLEGCVASGQHCTIVLSNVSQAQFDSVPKDTNICATSLLPHENKMSVLNFNVCQTAKCETNGVPVKSKDVLTFQVGGRMFKGRPIFSQHNLNSDKHKFERFLTQGVHMAASVYGPVTYGPCPVLVWRERAVDEMGGGGEEGEKELVAVGSVLGADADRIVVKRATLTGYPTRVHKRTCTVKYMFYNPDDVVWFKPATLTTKHGLVGHIMESIGTHGSMKCLFQQPIKQHDTVCLTLFKRVYPKYAEGDSEKLIKVW